MLRLKTLLLSTILMSSFLWSNADAADNPVIIELYTSQSCSSCPPADRLFEELVQEPNVIGVACHVDYWDHLHWKDTLSLKECTARQRLRASQIELGRVYTPNLVVNGRHSFVGSSSSKARKAIKAEQDRILAKIKGTYNSEAQILTYTVPQLASSKSPESVITLFAIEKERKQDIPRGENSGKTVNYVNSALMVKNLGQYNGKKEDKNLTLNLPKNTDSILLLANDRKSGEVIAYGTFDVN